MSGDDVVAAIGIAGLAAVPLGLLLAIWTGDARWAATAGVAFIVSFWLWLATSEDRRLP